MLQQIGGVRSFLHEIYPFWDRIILVRDAECPLSFLSLSELDLGASFGVLMCIDILGSTAFSWQARCLATVMLNWCFYVKHVTEQSGNDSVPSLSHIYITPVTFQAINEIIALACAILYDIVCLFY